MINTKILKEFDIDKTEIDSVKKELDEAASKLAELGNQLNEQGDSNDKMSIDYLDTQMDKICKITKTKNFINKHPEFMNLLINIPHEEENSES